MLDVTHYLLEEDSLRGIGMAEDPAKVVADMRAGIYRNLYKRGHGISAPDDDEVMPYETADGGARPRQVKPYIPPTDITENEALPYGNVVGAPLGF